MPEKILLDTNFVLIPANFGLDIYDELDKICNFSYELFIVDKTLDELKVLESRPKVKKKAKLARIILEKQLQQGNINIIDTKSNKKLADLYVDDVIKSLADQYIIATTDSELKKHLKRVVILRQKNHLELVK